MTQRFLPHLKLLATVHGTAAALAEAEAFLTALA
jgi:hypothetical protein